MTRLDETNPSIEATVRSKVEEFLGRAEALKREEGRKTKTKGKTKGKNKGEGVSSSPGGASDEESGMDAYTAGLRAQLKDIIMMEKPDVSMDDVAGLEDAKRAIEEGPYHPFPLWRECVSV